MIIIRSMGFVGLLLLAQGCSGNPPPDAGPNPQRICSSRSLDLLFVLDTTEGTGSLVRDFLASLQPFFVALDQGDANLDGSQDFEPFQDVRAAVTTMSRGLPDLEFWGCETPESPLLRRVLDEPECEPWTNEYVELTDPWEMARQLNCLEGLYTDACPIRQPLAAIDDALRHEPVWRDDALLAVVIVTRGDDCSVSDYEAFDPSSDLGNLTARCWTQAEALRPIDFLLGDDHPWERTLLFLNSGVPPDLIESGNLLSTDDPRLSYQEDPSNPPFATPTCRPVSSGPVYPPSRLLEFSEALPTSAHRTICDQDLDGLAEQLASTIARTFQEKCPLDGGT